jgi:RHS repeat-associated protein
MMLNVVRTIAVIVGSLLLSLPSFGGTVIRQSFHYDDAGRLIEVTSENAPELAEAYRYDASGNIIEKRQGTETIGMSYDKANQLTSRTDSRGTVEFVYDSAGRLIEEWQGETLLASYEYGYLDKVISVTRGTQVTRFHYNARGMLVGKERNGQIIETTGWDGIGLLAKGDTVYANEAHISGGTPLVSIDQGETSFYDHDYLGTTTAAYSADGKTKVKLTGSLGKGSETSEIRFTGKAYDQDLGAHVFPFRNYRSDAGRWTSADPAGFPDGPNQHFYAPIPTLSLDPLGLATGDTQWITGEYTLTASWTEERDFTLLGNPNFSVSFPWGISVSVSPGFNWKKIGAITTTVTAGTQPTAAESLLPAGWEWVPETITFVSSSEDPSPTYGAEYWAEVGQMVIYDISGFPAGFGPIFEKHRDATLNGIYRWKRQAREL